MVTHDLVVEDLLLLQLGEHALDLLGHLEVANALLLLVGGFVISQFK